MTSIKISNQFSTTSTTISNVFIDRYMPAANGAFVKVYLYLIRMASCGQCPTITDMADALNNTESDILRALKYWHNQGLLVIHCNSMNDLEFIELLPIANDLPETSAPNFHVVPTHARTTTPMGQMKSYASVPNTEAPELVMHPAMAGSNSGMRMTPSQPESISSLHTTNVPPTATASSNGMHSQQSADTKSATVSPTLATIPSETTAAPAKPNYDMRTIEKHIENSEMKHLPYEAEILLGKPISPEDLKTLYYLHDKLGLCANLISHLIEYCVMNNKKSMRYIEKTAINWHENHITTVEQAKTYCARYTKLNTAVMRAMGLSSGTLGEAQLAFIRKWSTEYGMDQTLIVEACNRTMLATGNASFHYADKILTNWHNAGITCLAQVEQEAKQFRASTAQKYKNNNHATGHTSVPNQFHDFIQGDDVDYDAIIPKTVQPLHD